MNELKSAVEQNLQEIEKIKTLKASYCRFLDTKQWAALRELLTEDAQLIFKDPKGGVLYKFDQREDMLAPTSAMLEAATTVHHVHNPEIELLSPTQARAIWAMEDHIIFPEGANGPFKTMHGYGHYHETLEKQGDDWKIKSLTLERLVLDHTY